MRNKSNLSLYVLLLVVTGALVAGSVYSYVRIVDLCRTSSSNIAVLKNHITSNLRTGYRALEDIDAGEMISESMVEYSTSIVSDVDQANFMTSDDIGKVAVSPISVGSPIMSNMVSAKLAEDYHERECSFIWLNTNLKDNDFVDVRILFPNGEDYIVAAKKSIKNVNVLANNVFLWLTEEEVQLLDAAIVDANLHNAKIYVTKYVKPTVQEASIPNYEPNSSVMRVMENDPNIVTESARVLSMSARADMEKRLQLFEEAYPGFQLDLGTGASSGNSSGTSGSANDDTVPIDNSNGSDTSANLNDTEDTGSDTTNDEESEVEYID